VCEISLCCVYFSAFVKTLTSSVSEVIDLAVNTAGTLYAIDTSKCQIQTISSSGRVLEWRSKMFVIIIYYALNRDTYENRRRKIV
jgi:hypothetical protein